MEMDKEQRSPGPDVGIRDDVILAGRAKGKETQGSPSSSLYSDQVETAEAVIWGEQITNTIRKLKSLTFFAVGSSPIPAPEPPIEVPEDKNKRKVKPGGQPPRRAYGGRKPKKAPLYHIFSAQQNGGSELSSGGLDQSMGLDENGFRAEEGGNSRDLVHEAFGLDDVANYECVSSEGHKAEVKTEDGEVTRVELDVDKVRKRRSNGTGEKPNNTYTEIIRRALEENPSGLTVSEIYDYISSRYSYYHPSDDRWKNSVRHNLSISPYFHKGEKAKHGAGHVWTIAEDCRDIRSNRFQRRGLLPKEDPLGQEVEGIDLSILKTESDFAVANILGNYTRACNGEEVNHVQQYKQQVECPLPVQEIEYAIHQECDGDNSGLFLTEGILECEGIQLHYDGILEEFEPTNQILSLGSEDPTRVPCLVAESGDLVDLEVVEPGMVLDISNYTFFESPGEQEAFFMEEDVAGPTPDHVNIGNPADTPPLVYNDNFVPTCPEQ